MQQVKMFTGLEGATGDLTRDINTWIRESGANIIQITGNIAPQSPGPSERPTGLAGSGSSAGRPPSDILVIILYTQE